MSAIHSVVINAKPVSESSEKTRRTADTSCGYDQAGNILLYYRMFHKVHFIADTYARNAIIASTSPDFCCDLNIVNHHNITMPHFENKYKTHDDGMPWKGYPKFSLLLGFHALIASIGELWYFCSMPEQAAE